jgi:membrane-associated phospholipid phosphatase
VWQIMRAITVSETSDWAQQLRRHAILAVIVAAYSALSWGLTSYHEVVISDNMAGVLVRKFATMVPQMIFLVLFGRLLHLTYVLKVEDRIGTLKQETAAFFTDRERMISGLVTVLIMSATLVAFAQLKNLIPVMNPFSWDVAFMELDKALHFGVLPHELLHAVFGNYYGISFFTGLYNIWLFMMYFTLVLACFLRPDSAIRMQFLIAFVLTWGIGGNLVATLFSSAGPVYYSLLGLGDTYADLMDRLGRHAATGALSVVETQNILWSIHTRPNSLNAISAFPSMHVASTVLMTIFAFKLSRLAGIIATFFAVAIMLGSVLLAWHYAVDGYAGALIALACWAVAGWLVRSRLGGFGTART